MSPSTYRGFTIQLCKNSNDYAVFGRTGAVLCVIPTIVGVMEYIDGLLGDEGLYD